MIDKIMQKYKFSKIFDYIVIIIGSIIASFAVRCILLCNGIIDYGTAGIAITLNKITGFNLSVLTVLIFFPFVIVAKFKLGNKFFIKSLLGSICYSLGLEIFDISKIKFETEHFIAVAFGGALLGMGLAMILKCGGCIDGSEIFANIVLTEINKNKQIMKNMNTMLIAFNALVYVFAAFVFGLNSALLSFLAYFISIMVVDRITNRFESIKKVTVISNNKSENDVGNVNTCELLAHEIKEQMNKTSTLVKSYGIINGSNVTLTCYITYFELEKFKDIVNSFDDSLFVVIADVDEIYVN